MPKDELQLGLNREEITRLFLTILESRSRTGTEMWTEACMQEPNER